MDPIRSLAPAKCVLSFLVLVQVLPITAVAPRVRWIILARLERGMRGSKLQETKELPHRDCTVAQSRWSIVISATFSASLSTTS